MLLYPISELAVGAPEPPLDDFPHRVLPLQKHLANRIEHTGCELLLELRRAVIDRLTVRLQRRDPRNGPITEHGELIEVNQHILLQVALARSVDRERDRLPLRAAGCGSTRF